MKNLIFILSLSFVLSFGQSKYTLSKSEYQKLHDKARFHINSLIDSSFYYANKIELSNNNLHKSFAYGIKSYLYQKKGDSITSNNLYNKSLIYLNKTAASNEKTKLLAYLLNYKGLTEWKRGNFNKALVNFLEGKKLSTQANDIVQVIKFNYNLALVYGDIKKYNLAIKTSKDSDDLIEKNKKSYSTSDYNLNKSNVYYGLGNFYYYAFYQKSSNLSLIDSATYYYKKCLIYSNEIAENTINAQIALSNIYFYQNKLDLVEKNYINLLFYSKEKKLFHQEFITNYDLGCLYFKLKKYNKSLLYFKKAEDLNTIYHFNSNVYLNIIYYLSKNYDLINDHDNALKYSNLYLEKFEKNEFKLNQETTSINSNIENQNIEKEMLEIKNKYKNEVLLKKITFFGIVISIVCLIIFLVKNMIEKNKIKKNTEKLIQEFSTKINEKEKLLEKFERPSEKEKKPITGLNIDEEKEKEILEQLKKLELKQFYLKSEFNLQDVAKKLKTNTTYLSYVVNKNFQKSFSEYSNELKINYVINEIINNSTYRKYSTQAIAESVGFKNAVSFTKSFNKRTGVTPAQFIKEISQNSL